MHVWITVYCSFFFFKVFVLITHRNSRQTCLFIGIHKVSIKLSNYHPKIKSRPLNAALVLATVWYLGNPITRYCNPNFSHLKSLPKKNQIIPFNKIYNMTFLFWKPTFAILRIIIFISIIRIYIIFFSFIKIR